MLIIFDCDGVLVDSEALASHVFAEQLAEEGLPLTAEQCQAKFQGLTLSDCLLAIEQEFMCTLSIGFLERLKEATQQRFEHALMPVKGVEQVLSWVQESGHAMCVASNGGREKIRHSLTVTRLLPHFNHLFSADQVARGKPEPDLFLFAARALGYAPSACIVVEDSVAGVRAAQSAGMNVIFYGEGRSEWGSTVPVFTDMKQLPGMLAGLSARVV